MSNFIDIAIAKAKNGDLSEVESKGFPLALKKIRAENEIIYDYDYKPELKRLLAGHPELFRVIDKHSKPPTKRRARQAAKAADGGNNEVSKRGESLSTAIIELVEAKADLFCNKAGRAYITFTYDLPINTETGEVLQDYIQTLELMASKEQLSYLLYESSGIAPPDGALNDALRVLVQKAKAYPSQEVYRRYGEVLGDRSIIYIDLELKNEAQKVVEVSGDGWRAISMSECPIRFSSGHNSYPLPVPERGGDIALLWDYINVQDEESRLLVLAWLLECMRVNTEYPLLEIASGAGCGKTSAQSRLKRLVDPSPDDVVSAPNSLRDMQATVINSHLVSLDNLGKLSPEFHNLFCMCCTGGAVELRALYTTNKLERYSISRPVVVNGICDLVEHDDLAQRTIGLELSRLSQNVERSGFNARWEVDYPKILGALYDLLATVLRDLPLVDIDPKVNPRLGDFAKLGQALCFGLGSSFSFVDIYKANFERVIGRGLESNPAALALIKLMSDTGLFEGTASELLHQLNSETCKPKYFDRKNWPNDPQALARKIRVAEPTLRLRGIGMTITRGRSNKSVYLIEDPGFMTRKPNEYTRAKGLLS